MAKKKRADLIEAYGVWAGFGTGIMVLDRSNKYEKVKFLADLQTQDDVKLFLKNKEVIRNMPNMDAASFKYYLSVAKDNLVPEQVPQVIAMPEPVEDPIEKLRREELEKWEKELLPNVVEEDNGDEGTNGTEW